MSRANRFKEGDPKLIRHLEKHLGPIQAGWPMRSAGEAVFIVKFEDQPFAGAVTFTTLGLSETILHQLAGGNTRQELLFSTYATENDEEIASLVMTVVDEIVEANHALARGQVLGPAGPILDDAKAEALYCTHPVYFPDPFHTVTGVDPAVYFVWLVPVMKAEATFVRNHGWDKFETLLEKQNPDLLNLNRKPVRLR